MTTTAYCDDDWHDACSRWDWCACPCHADQARETPTDISCSESDLGEVPDAG